MPKLCVRTQGGKEYVSIWLQDDMIPRPNQLNDKLGSYTFIDITPEMAEWSIAKITEWFQAAKTKEEKQPKWKTDPVLRANMLERLDAIIRQSNQEGEVANSKTLFKKITGKDWVS